MKREVFRRLDACLPPDAGIATNSSNIVVSRLADATPRPQLCCNMHFFHPVLVMDLCEVVRGPQTAEDTVQRALAWSRRMGRTPILVEREIDGFIVNRVLGAASREAFTLLAEGVASVADIDTATRAGLNWPMGPFQLADFSGLDVVLGVRRDRLQREGQQATTPPCASCRAWSTPAGSGASRARVSTTTRRTLRVRCRCRAERRHRGERPYLYSGTMSSAFEKIDHVGIAVADLDAAVATYARLTGAQPAHRQAVESDGIEAVMFEVGESRIELLGSTRADSKIARFLSRRGGGLHHVAYGVADVQQTLDHFAGLGLRLLDTCPRRGAAGRLVAFLHPSAAGGVLTELCQPPDPPASEPVPGA